MATDISINTDGLAKCMDIIVHCTGWHAHGIKKNAEAQYYADELAVKSANNVALLKEQGNEALAEYIFTREQRKASNVAHIAQKAAEQFSPGEQVHGDTPSQDWLNRYFDYAEDISEEEMQNLWAKLLHDEIKSPKSFSKRTLDVIRNLSSDEAKLMNKYAGRITGDSVAYINTDDDLDDMIRLDDAGLMNSDSLERTYHLKAGKRIQVCSDRNYVLMISSSVDMDIAHGIRPLTEAGRQIAKLIDPSMDLTFMERLAETIVKTKNIRVTLHQIVFQQGNHIKFIEKPIWEKSSIQTEG